MSSVKRDWYDSRECKKITREFVATFKTRKDYSHLYREDRVVFSGLAVELAATILLDLARDRCPDNRFVTIDPVYAARLLMKEIGMVCK